MGGRPDARGPRTTGRPRVLLGLAALLVLALLAIFLWPRADADGTRRGTEPPTAERPPPPPGPEAGVAAAPPADELPETVQRYLEATVYPPDSGRLTADHRDLLHPNARYELPRPIPETISDDPSRVVRTLLTADRYHVESGEAAYAILQAWRGSTPIPTQIDVIEADLVPEGCAGTEDDPARVSFVLRGDGLDATLPFSALDDHHGFVRLDVRFAVARTDEVQEGQLRFFHTPSRSIPARLLPERMSDSVEQGSLRIELDVDVRDPGFYRFDANLFGKGDRPVAFTHFKGELGAGRQTVPFVVHGKVLRDAGIAGPYRVDQLRGYRFLDGQCPDRENLPATDASFTTASYPLSAFSDEPYTSEHKQHMVDMMLADHAAGIGPEWPDLPPESGQAAGPAGPDRHDPPPPPAPGAEDDR